MIVDAHLHLFRNGYGRFRAEGAAREVDTYEQLMDRHGIAAGLVVCRAFMLAIQNAQEKCRRSVASPAQYLPSKAIRN